MHIREQAASSICSIQLIYQYQGKSFFMHVYICIYIHTSNTHTHTHVHIRTLIVGKLPPPYAAYSSSINPRENPLCAPKGRSAAT